MANPKDLAAKWGPRLRETREAKRTAALTHEQTVRDAHADGMPVNAMSRELGTRDRTTLTRYLANPPEPVPAVTLPTVVWLRGAGRSQETWAEMRQMMAARGWYTVTSEQDAWHLSRAGAVCVRVNFSALEVHHDRVDVELLRAVHAQPAQEPSYAVADLLPTGAAVALRREHPEAADYRVQVQTTEQDWKRLAGRTYGTPERFDPDRTNNLGQPGAYGVLDCPVIARWVADLLE
ncbi:hypothetical protein [Streptomyces chumphonensis]|uniref:hypothetical protein n=1 Tax=Streptomyces chumphonensis TaxID=1214925 RepID=UPI003D7498DC